MYEELVKDLREFADDGYMAFTRYSEVMTQAADAIEELQEKLLTAETDLSDLADALKVLPAADVVPVRRGRWYKFTKVSFGANSGVGVGRYMYKCDVCNVGEEETKMPYCPNCGAKMEDEE